jgi:trehalose 6-phosphate phosphatase
LTGRRKPGCGGSLVARDTLASREVDVEQVVMAGEDRLRAWLQAAAAAPRATALFCDIDGTVSPIAARPADAVVPAATLELLGALVGRLGLVAFVTGRALEDGRRMVPFEQAAYVGTHGIEVQLPGGPVQTDPQAERHAATVAALADKARRDLDSEALGLVIEDKRTVLAVHYRLAPDPSAARHAILTHVVEPARRQGLAVGTGHFVYEVRPPVPASKGSAVRRLLAAREYTATMVCGDDLTDVTGFAAVREWGEGDARRHALALAAVTSETPRPVRDEADVLVGGTRGVVSVLQRLLEAAGG